MKAGAFLLHALKTPQQRGAAWITGEFGCFCQDTCWRAVNPSPPAGQVILTELARPDSELQPASRELAVPWATTWTHTVGDGLGLRERVSLALGPRREIQYQPGTSWPKRTADSGKKAEMKPQVQDWQVASRQIADGLTLCQGKSWTGLFESKPRSHPPPGCVRPSLGSCPFLGPRLPRWVSI